MDDWGNSRPIPTASVVLPTLNAGKYLSRLVEALLEQKPTPPREIIIIDSGSDDHTVALAKELDGPIHLLSIKDFSHGRARNIGARSSTSDIVVFLSQDAVPANNIWLRELLTPFSNRNVAASFSRQTPWPDANPMEAYFLRTHFPEGEVANIYMSGSEELVFQKNVFFSNVSSAILRSALLEYPFNERLIMSEDQQFACDILRAGFSVAYVPSSVVVHSHNYTITSAIGRYFDSVYSLRKIFPRHSLLCSAALGATYLRRESAHMLRHHPKSVVPYAGFVLAKTIGTLLGHAGDYLPRWLARRISLHKYWWT